MEKAQRVKRGMIHLGANVGGSSVGEVWIPDENGPAVMHASHAAIVAELVGLLGRYRDSHSRCTAPGAPLGGDIVSGENRCSLCKKFDELK